MHQHDAAAVRGLLLRTMNEQRDLKRQLADITAECRALRHQVESAPRSITDELDRIEGRRIAYSLNGTQRFTESEAGQRGQPINFLVSQDGPFVWTHQPQVMWRPSEPTTATRFGRWRPVYTWPLADQVLNEDVIDVSWELVDSGSQRNFQNLPTNPMFSRPDKAIPLSVPTLFAPNSTIQFFPTYEAINFSTESTPTRAGILSVSLPGYRIVNM